MRKSNDNNRSVQGTVADIFRRPRYFVIDVGGRNNIVTNASRLYPRDIFQRTETGVMESRQLT